MLTQTRTFKLQGSRDVRHISVMHCDAIGARFLTRCGILKMKTRHNNTAYESIRLIQLISTDTNLRPHRRIHGNNHQLHDDNRLHINKAATLTSAPALRTAPLRTSRINSATPAQTRRANSTLSRRNHTVEYYDTDDYIFNDHIEGLCA